MRRVLLIWVQADRKYNSGTSKLAVILLIGFFLCLPNVCPTVYIKKCVGMHFQCMSKADSLLQFNYLHSSEQTAFLNLQANYIPEW